MRSPLRILVALASFAIAGWALWRVLGTLSDPWRFAIWFAGAIVAHDLLLLPLYSLLGAVAGHAVAGEPPTALRVAALNHLRVPLMLSGLMLLVWFPLIAQRNSAGYMRASGLSADVFLERWLLLSAALLLASALAFALRLRGLRQ
jgi:hypothetical protein